MRRNLRNRSARYYGTGQAIPASRRTSTPRKVARGDSVTDFLEQNDLDWATANYIYHLYLDRETVSDIIPEYKDAVPSQEFLDLLNREQPRPSDVNTAIYLFYQDFLNEHVSSSNRAPRKRANVNRPVNRRVANADHAEAVDFVFSSFDKDLEEFEWLYINDYDKLYADVKTILSRGFTGGPFDIDKIISDVVNGKSRFANRRANYGGKKALARHHKRANDDVDYEPGLYLYTVNNTYFVFNASYPDSLTDEWEIVEWAEDEYGGWFTDVQATYYDGVLNLLLGDGSGSMRTAIETGMFDPLDVDYMDSNGEYRPLAPYLR